VGPVRRLQAPRLGRLEVARVTVVPTAEALAWSLQRSRYAARARELRARAAAHRSEAARWGAMADIFAAVDLARARDLDLQAARLEAKAEARA
jgi:hypothetical protein